MSASRAFLALCAGFLERLGASIPADEELAEGFEFESEGLSARIERGLEPDEHDSEGDFLITIAVSELDLDDPGALADRLLLLARLNHCSRREHPWIAAVDAAQQLVLLRRVPLTNPTVEHLEQTITEGLELGQSLRELWKVAGAQAASWNTGRPAELPFLNLPPGLKA